MCAKIYFAFFQTKIIMLTRGRKGYTSNEIHQTCADSTLLLIDCALSATQPALFLPRKAEFSINFGKLIVSPRYHNIIYAK